MSTYLSLMCYYCQEHEECHVVLSNVTPNNPTSFFPSSNLPYITAIPFDLCPSLFPQSTFLSLKRPPPSARPCFCADIKHSSSAPWQISFLCVCSTISYTSSCWQRIKVSCLFICWAHNPICGSLNKEATLEMWASYVKDKANTLLLSVAPQLTD